MVFTVGGKAFRRLVGMPKLGRRRGRAAGGLTLAAVLGVVLLLGASGFSLAKTAPGSAKPVDNPPAASAGPKADAAPPPAGEPPLPSDALVRLGTLFPRQRYPIEYCAFTPDGRWLLTVGTGGVYVRDAGNGAEVRRFGEFKSLRSADLSRDGTRLATLDYSGEGGARVWDVATGSLVGKVAVPPVPPGSPRICLSPDGKKLAYSCSREPGIALYDVETGARLLAWNAARERIWDVAFLPDGSHLVSGGDDPVIRVWDAATGKLAREIGSDLGETGRIAVSPDGNHLATIGQRRADAPSQVWQGDDFVRLWDLKTGKLLRRLSVPPGATHPNFPSGLNALAFTPDGKRLLAGGVDRAVRVWDLASGEEPRRIPEAAGIPGRLAVSPDGKRLAVVTASVGVIPRPNPPGIVPLRRPPGDSVLLTPAECLHLRDLDTGRDPGPTAHAGGVTLSALSPDGRLAATACPGPEILLWDATTGRLHRRLSGHENEVMALAWADGGRTLLSAGTDRTLRAWEAATGKEIRKVPARGNVKVEWPAGPHGKAAFSPDGKLLAVVDGEGGIVITETATGKEAHSLGVRSGAASHVCFAPVGGALLIVTTESLVYSWDTREGLELRKCEVRGPSFAPYLLFDAPADAAVTPDGKILALNREDGTLVTVETATERVVHFAQRRDQLQTRLAISPDGHTLAWGGGSVNPRILLYEMATDEMEKRRSRLSLAGHADRVLSLSFSADGRKLLSGSEDGTALVWDLGIGPRSGKEVALTAERLDALWADLLPPTGPDGDTPVRAYRAVRSLAGSPKTAVPFLRKVFSPAGPVDEERISRLIAELGSDEAGKPEKALGELDEIGEAALPQIRKALEGQPAAAAAQHLRQLVAWKYRDFKSPSPARLRELRALEVLQLADTPEAWKVVEEISRGEPTARRTQLAKAALATRADRVRQPAPAAP
jgi:WD40 repeat protein